jgi:hypothetical protein
MKNFIILLAIIAIIIFLFQSFIIMPANKTEEQKHSTIKSKMYVFTQKYLAYFIYCMGFASDILQKQIS